ncbi:hypothetical protein BDA96_04G043400 [Sorghum bicolor]|uniref:Uncharacterized protein n=2 Tax=Sorghum bicolor TaxID=4558 RepID=A0A921R0D6_SORBI|nr:hypothetical protein BDA96_04G043400 [Sorghum bicolor]OQU84354.1 hypothetical protein SORBI_3004G038850 [Sorghum bicolor]
MRRREPARPLAPAAPLACRLPLAARRRLPPLPPGAGVPMRRSSWPPSQLPSQSRRMGHGKRQFVTFLASPDRDRRSPHLAVAVVPQSPCKSSATRMFVTLRLLRCQCLSPHTSLSHRSLLPRPRPETSAAAYYGSHHSLKVIQDIFVLGH